MSNIIDTPVLIVGGGPVGLSVALDLGWRGVECTLVDETDGTLEHSKIGHIAVRTMEIFRRWGIAQAVRSAGFPDDFRMSRVICTSVSKPPLYVDEHPPLRDMPVPAYSCEKKQRCPQHLLQPLLQRAVQAYPCVGLRYGCKLERFEPSAEHVIAKVRDLRTGATQTVRAKHLVACDGVDSAVRESLGIAVRGQPKLSYSIGITARIPDFLRYSHYGEAERFIFLGPEGTWGNLTTVDGPAQWRLTIYGSDEKLDLERLDPAAWMRRAIGRDDARVEVLYVLPWRRREQIAERFRFGRVLLAGDSAHAMSPTGGMGMNTGIGDAADLGWKLQAMTEGWGGERLLESYEIERKPVAVRNATSSTDNFKTLTSVRPSPAITDETDEGDRVRRRITEAFTAAMKASYWEASGIQMGYRYDDSPIVVADGTPPPPEQGKYVQTARPGARAPHAWLADGRSTLDLFGRDFVLMRFPAASDASVAAFEAAARAERLPLSVARIDDAAVAALYDAPLVLVRPDGHVAWRGASAADAAQVVRTVRGG
jgi:2-polyprenyl-6-methoxyphenol hydroxylase-like FAD-dependent oxidoreductase